MGKKLGFSRRIWSLVVVFWFLSCIFFLQYVQINTYAWIFIWSNHLNLIYVVGITPFLGILTDTYWGPLWLLKYKICYLLNNWRLFCFGVTVKYVVVSQYGSFSLHIKLKGSWPCKIDKFLYILVQPLDDFHGPWEFCGHNPSSTCKVDLISNHSTCFYTLSIFSFMWLTLVIMSLSFLYYIFNGLPSNLKT